MMKALRLAAVFVLSLFSNNILSQQIDFTDFNIDWNGWTAVNGSFTNKWELGNSTGYNLSNGAYISNDGGTINAYSMDKASVVHIYKDIDFSQATNTLVLSFRWRCTGEESLDYLSVHVVPTTVTPVAGEELNQGQLSSTELFGRDYYSGKRFNLSDKMTEPTMRVVFTWRNNESGGSQPPAAIDNIEFTNLDLNYGMWESRTQVPSGRYYSASLKNSFSLITLGGFNSTNTPLSQVLEFDMIGDRWTQLSPLPGTFTHSTAVKFDGFIYNIGGFKNSGNEPTDEVNRLSLSDFNWSSFTSYPKQVFYSKSLRIGGNLYVVGGSDENNVLLNDVNYLAKGSDTWNPATPLPGDGRADGGLTKLDQNRILYIGGFTNERDNSLQVDSVFVGTINPDDPGDITWKAGANFPGGHRARFNAYPWGTGKAIVVGGSPDAGFSASNDAWIYNADTDSWTELGTWTQLPNIPAPVTAYQGTSFNLFDNVWMLFIAGGVTTGPFVTANNEVYIDTVNVPVSVQLISNKIPSDFYLSQNYPNPFNPITRIRYKIPADIKGDLKNVTLKVYDILGKEITILVDQEQSAGEYEVDFNGRDLSSGVYFYKLQSGGYSDAKKFLLVK